MNKTELEAEIKFHLERVDSLTRTAKLCRKISNKLRCLGWINRHAKIATELRGKLNGWDKKD
jgi:hypothetical protein